MKTKPPLTDEELKLARAISSMVEPTALRMRVGEIADSQPAELDWWSDGQAELTMRPGLGTLEQLKVMRWALDLLESKLRDDGGYRTALRLVVGAQ